MVDKNGSATVDHETLFITVVLYNRLTDVRQHKPSNIIITFIDHLEEK